jgi:hypothetical protein
MYLKTSRDNAPPDARPDQLTPFKRTIRQYIADDHAYRVDLMLDVKAIAGTPTDTGNYSGGVDDRFGLYPKGERGIMNSYSGV